MQTNKKELQPNEEVKVECDEDYTRSHDEDSVCLTVDQFEPPLPKCLGNASVTVCIYCIVLAEMVDRSS